jgi:L-alanine-DL-glutamate epimerase-like enolase superfamily enzyme
VVELQSRSGDAGYGEGGPATAAEIVEARTATTARRATEWEFIRARLAQMPAMEAAVNNAMLDLLARSRKIPVRRNLSGRTRFTAGCWRGLKVRTRFPQPVRWNGRNGKGSGRSLCQALQRDAMIPLQEYVVRCGRALRRCRAWAGLEPNGCLTAPAQ